jgi:hypothetical protein
MDAAWQFTPTSFFQIVSFLHKIGLTGLVPERVCHTGWHERVHRRAAQGAYAIEQDRAFIQPRSLDESVSVLKKANRDYEQQIEKLKDELNRASSPSMHIENANA